MPETIHFFEFLEYSNIENLDFQYNNPVKNSQKTYMSMLKTPLEFFLPKSEISDFYQDDFGNNLGNYIINIEDNVELLTFLENLDNLCIEHAAKYSENWFKKNLDSKVLVKYYNPLYEMSSTEEELFLPIQLQNVSDIDTIQNYNSSPTDIISVKIIGIEFFKQTFKWILEFGSVVSDLDNSEDEDEEINFNTIMDNNENDTEYYRSSSNVYDNISNEDDTSSEEDLHSENDINSNSDIEVVNKEHHLSEEENDIIDNEVQDRVNDNSDEQHIKGVSGETVVSNDCVSSDKVSTNSKNNISATIESDNNISQKDLSNSIEQIDNSNQDIDNSPVINDEIVADLADNVNNSDKLDKINKSDNVLENTPLQLDISTKNEIESLISEKRIEVKKYMLNAERAKRASQSLSVKAIAANREVSIYEEKLKNLCN